MAGQWVPDVLGKPFEQLTLDLGLDGASGPLVATLVRSIPNPLVSWTQPLRDVDVLYVHGWSDFFFQTELARFWNGLGARFYALDLRRYGRSLRPGQTPGFIDALDDYDADIEAALAEMGHGTDAASSRRLVLLGHSTGGLILTLWAARHAGRATALVLNSPWLELQLGAIGRQAI
ncbi:MAG: alpha/beta hydrolase, partial [Microbacterium sp.]